MNSHDLISPTNADAEVFALIQTLHETGRRLEELTGGEVDTVAGRDGRIFLLQRAQDHLRLSESAKQAAILDALPAHIALLDTEGCIVSVNAAWRRFTHAHVLQGPGYGIGVNYLRMCDSALGESAGEAHEAARGIRCVLAGEAPSFAMTYSYLSPADRRWFLMSITPLSDAFSSGVVVMHLDVSAERQAKEVLHISESRFRSLTLLSSDWFWEQDAEYRFVKFSGSKAIDTEGKEQIAAIGSRGWEIPGLTPTSTSWEDHRALLEARKPFRQLVYRRDVEGGAPRYIEVSGEPIFDASDRYTGYRGVATDITERKNAESKIGQLNRVYAMLSAINTLIVRVHDRDDLFREACRIAVDAGGFSIAWIGILDRSTQKIVPLASAGANEKLLADLKDRIALTPDATLGNNLSAWALREKIPAVSNSAQNDPRVVFGKKYAEAGIHSVAMMPLIVYDEAVGVLALYADEHDFFREEELKLVTELAGDIAFAIDHIDKQDRLEYLAYYDVLTGLANRKLFLERVAQHMRSAASSGHKLALFLFDLERFKNINDSLGQPAGDAILRQVAQWLARRAGDASLVARVEADHFAVVLPVVEPETDLARYLEETMAAFLEQPFRLEDAVFRIAVRVGGAVYPDDGAGADALFKNAEAALKAAKASGNRYLFHTQKMTANVAGKLTLENQLRQALDKEEFVLHYQPKLNIVSGKITGAEALIRWNDPRTGLVPPGHFIPLLEETGLIYEVGRWALHQALADYLRWRAAGLGAVRIAVNVSPLQLRNRGFIAEVEQAIGIDAHAAAGLELEITESLLMEDVKHSIASLQTIRAMGATIAIDDFGTGFSSLSYLSKLPADTLKIDRSFVIGMTGTPEGLALVSTIINLAHSLKLKVVAEGVETEEQSHLLRLLDCDELQGYLFSRPVPGEIFSANFLPRLAPA
ncbi:MAG TPA: EAL domain-containing protein [Burkholderiaceae bacterium]|nr:EAL domain-containing protein [Burkholderiaceae bacterium]